MRWKAGMLNVKEKGRVDVPRNLRWQTKSGHAVVVTITCARHVLRKGVLVIFFVSFSMYH